MRDAYTQMCADAVEKAAPWMDVRHPGWASRIDPDTLDIRVPCRCIGGQLSGGDINMWQELNDGIVDDLGPGDHHFAFSMSGALPFWREVILARRQTASPEAAPARERVAS